jgi:hypothetical protein
MECSGRDKVQTIKGDTHDTLDEAKERLKSGAEKAKRAVEGDRTPLDERVGERVEDGI